MKIHIIGGPGSGKTTLAECISSKFNVAHHDLDKIGWKHGMAPLAVYVEEVFTILKQPAWITEGIFLFWTDPLLHEADYIVLFDIPWSLAVWRVLRRHIAKSLRGTNPYATKLLFPLFKFMSHFYDRSDTPPTEFVRKYLEAYQEMTEPPAAGFTEEFMRRYLETYQEISEPPTEEFIQMYHEKYKDGAESPPLGFLRMYHEKFRATVEPNMTIGFVCKYLEKYKEKVIIVKNNADRERLLELLSYCSS